MKRFSLLPLLAAFLSVLHGCEPDTYETMMASAGTPGGKATVSLSVSAGDLPSKSSLGSPESVDSGLQLFVYFHDTGLLEGVYELASRSSQVSLTAGRPLDFFLVGNMWFLDSVTGRKAGYAGLLSEDFPVRRDDLLDPERLPAYRLGGGSVGGTLRTETFGEIATYGLPYAGSRTDGVTVHDGGTLSLEATFLFTRVDVTVDHAGIDAGADGIFRNSTLRVVNANCSLHPFLPSSALRPEDILSESDHEPSMADGRKLTFTLYVPENRQTGLGFVNASPDGKTRDAIVSQGICADMLTYVEFTASADPSAGGYGGDYTYRFYLGRNNTDDFDLQRGGRLAVSLGFRAGSLFDSFWKVEGTLEDTRTLYFSVDPDGISPLAEGRTLAVRRNRAASTYVYFSRSGAPGSNESQSYLDAWTDGYAPSDLTRSAFRYEFGDDVSALGITPSYNAATGELTLSVTDPSRFIPGRTIPLTLTLYPGGTSRTVNVRTADDLKAGLSGDGPWYVAMRRDLTLGGFVGEGIQVSVEGGGDCLKGSPVPAAQFLGNTPVEASAGTMSFYAFRPCAGAKIRVRSDDPMNDGEYEFDFSVRDPVLDCSGMGPEVVYLAHGDEVPLRYRYRDEDGFTLERSLFDDAVFAQTLRLRPVSIVGDVFSGLGFTSSAPDAYGGETIQTYLYSPMAVQNGLGAVYAGGHLFYESRSDVAKVTGLFKVVSADGTHQGPSLAGQFPNIWVGGIKGVWYDSNHDGIETPDEIQLVTLDFGDVDILAMHDYSTLNQTVLPEHLKKERSKDFVSMQLWFGVAHDEDLMIDVIPLAVSSPENRSLRGTFVRDHGSDVMQVGSLHFEFRQDDNRHSFGRHRVLVGVENKHSHEKISQHLGNMDVYLYIGLAADFYVAGMKDDELEIDFGGVLVANEANVPPLIDRYLTDNNIKVGYDAHPVGPVDSSLLPGTQGGYSSSVIRAENQTARPVWESDHRTDEDFDYPYMKLFVSGNDYLLDKYRTDRELVMQHFFPRVKFIDDHGVAFDEVSLRNISGLSDPMTDDFIHLITSNFYDPTNFVRGWLDKVMVQ